MKLRSYKIPSVPLSVFLVVYLFVYLSVCFSICPEFFSGTTCRNFLFSCLKLECNVMKSGRAKFFEKNLVLGFSGLKGSKCGFSSSWKSTFGISLIFCIKLQQRKVLKLTGAVFRGKSCFEIFVLRGAWRPNVRHFKLYQKLMQGNSVICCIKLQQHKGWKSDKIILTKSLFCGFWNSFLIFFGELK